MMVQVRVMHLTWIGLVIPVLAGCQGDQDVGHRRIEGKSLL
jgi:hypothetical protein